MEVKVFFGTNRNLITIDGKVTFGNELVQQTHFGWAPLTYSADGRWTVGELNIETAPFVTLFSLAAGITFATAGARFIDDRDHRPFTTFIRALDAIRKLCAFIPGAAYDFNGSLVAAAEIGRVMYDHKALVLVFSYPSGGEYSIRGYLRDRRHVAASGLAMSDAFEALLRFTGPPTKNGVIQAWFFAHSLGNFAARVAVQAIEDAKQLPADPVFETAFLLAADDDRNTLSKQSKMRPLIQIARSIYAYFNRQDTLLMLSDFLHDTPLGLKGPKNIDREQYGGCQVISVDCSIIGSRDDQHGHRYHLYTREAWEDIRAVIAGAASDAVPRREKLSARRYRIRP